MQKTSGQPIRHGWVDVLKGFGIILVVAGHVFAKNTTHVIYMFHMPLFFFLSGFLCKPVAGHSGFVTKKAVALLLPYLVFLIVIYIPYAWLGYRKGEITIPEVATAFFLGGHLLVGWAGTFWFITTLFIVQVLFNW